MHICTQTAEETEELGARLALARPAADRALAVLYLSGELGSGKTTFARGFARAAGVRGRVRSPTYTLLEPYVAGDGTLVHLDLYRVQSPAELDSLGLREWAAPGHVWLIEWPEHGAGRLPAADLVVTFAASASGHQIEVTGTSALGAAWLVQPGDAGRGEP
ncbi:MAG TPA: tRNA (adenosine(37)-N6)-threonylcarbamoyltransferase complex ATPase subunit type 1 TsaE [Steroidobacteraceae bacterium]|nr:tRNA (adenosine(37)-N6)-threonylcarbamoyltransferase complex ATPase subunit type 1 TsaE [Steroidobacteraceae bacterium]